jgi:hypothetical protein
MTRSATTASTSAGVGSGRSPAGRRHIVSQCGQGPSSPVRSPRKWRRRPRLHNPLVRRGGRSLRDPPKVRTGSHFNNNLSQNRPHRAATVKDRVPVCFPSPHPEVNKRKAVSSLNSVPGAHDPAIGNGVNRGLAHGNLIDIVFRKNSERSPIVNCSRSTIIFLLNACICEFDFSSVLERYSCIHTSSLCQQR